MKKSNLWWTLCVSTLPLRMILRMSLLHSARSRSPSCPKSCMVLGLKSQKCFQTGQYNPVIMFADADLIRVIMSGRGQRMKNKLSRSWSASLELHGKRSPYSSINWSQTPAGHGQRETLKTSLSSWAAISQCRGTSDLGPCKNRSY